MFTIFPSEKPVLGKISLIRRAKSAVARSASAKRTNDKHPLFHVAWDEHIGIANDGFVFDETAQTPIAEDVTHHPVTVEEAKRTMEQFHMRKCTPPLSSKVMDEKTGKYIKTRRVKTAKNKYEREQKLCFEFFLLTQSIFTEYRRLTKKLAAVRTDVVNRQPIQRPTRENVTTHRQIR